MEHEHQNLWTHAAEHFQNALSDSWAKALASFQNIHPAASGAPDKLAAANLQFSQEKLQELQQQYLKEAAELMAQGAKLQAPVAADKRFSSAAWASNPVAAFTAAL